MSANRSSEVRGNVAAIAAEFAAARGDRIQRRTLASADFERLADAGFLLTGVPAEQGGLWRGLSESVREYAELVRVLAEGDPCVALVAAMHPSVLVFWLAVDEPRSGAVAWRAQRAEYVGTAIHGHWWGTMISEPGSGGDLLRTRTRAEPSGADYRLSGEKHFGSGSGITSFMITTGRVDGEPAPDLFVIDVRDRPWDGSAGLTLRKSWTATA